MIRDAQRIEHMLGFVRRGLEILARGVKWSGCEMF